ncbi:hypothetical protein ABT096_32420 [Streptomyces sp. NPDC002561]|uniref:hypothetical protein n=1 Tax=Streptomyces sp. NPDC002561 TaxID=3154418 RepID=UPI00332DCCA6
MTNDFVRVSGPLFGRFGLRFLARRDLARRVSTDRPKVHSHGAKCSCGAYGTVEVSVVHNRSGEVLRHVEVGVQYEGHDVVAPVTIESLPPDKPVYKVDWSRLYPLSEERLVENELQVALQEAYVRYTLPDGSRWEWRRGKVWRQWPPVRSWWRRPLMWCGLSRFADAPACPCTSCTQALQNRRPRKRRRNKESSHHV